VVQRGSVAGCRVGGSDGGGAVRGEGTIDVGARVDGGEVRELERLSKHHSIIDEHAGSGGRVVESQLTTASSQIHCKKSLQH